MCGFSQGGWFDMRIYRGDVGISLSLEEFNLLLSDTDRIDDMLNLINELEMDRQMNHFTNFNESQYIGTATMDSKSFEDMLLNEIEEIMTQDAHTNKTFEEADKVNRIMKFLDEYGRQ